jgi:outer membrane protein TolC
MKSFSLALIVSFVAFHCSFAQDTLTVQTAVRYVLTHHPAVTQASENARAAEARVMVSRSSLYPDVTTQALYTRLGPVAQLSVPILGSFKLYPENNYDAHVGARYTLYDFGKVDATINLNSSRAQLANDAIDLTKTGLAYQTIRVFYSILFLERSIQVQNEQIDALDQHLVITKRRVAAGTATNFEILTTRVRVAAAQNQKIELENALQKQQAGLRQLMGLTSDAPLRLSGEFEAAPLAPGKDSLLQAAFNRRTEMRFARDAQHSAELQYKLSSLGKMPSLRLNLNYGLKNGYIPDLDVLRGNWAAGVMLEFPVYDGGRTDHQKEESQAMVMADQAHLKDVEQQVRSEVDQAYADLQAASAKVPISQLQVQQATEAVAIARTRYETGSITNLDLLDAETAQSAAKLANLQALYRLVISRYEVEQAIGVTPFE